MAALIIILLLIICTVLVGFVLIQNPKGGGLGTSLGGLNNNMFGVQRTTDFLERTTWGFAIAVLSLCLLTAMFKPRASKTTTVSKQESAVDKLLKSSSPSAVPMQQPQQQPQGQPQQQGQPAQGQPQQKKGG